MGTAGHSVIISSNDQEFLHIHEAHTNWRGGPNIHFKDNFPISGLYKIWG